MENDNDKNNKTNDTDNFQGNEKINKKKEKIIIQ